MQELTSLPDYGKIEFNDEPGIPLECLLPDAPCDALDFLKQVLTWNPSSRLTASAALAHPFLALRTEDEESSAMSTLAAYVLRAAERRTADAGAKWALPADGDGEQGERANWTTLFSSIPRSRPSSDEGSGDGDEALAQEAADSTGDKLTVTHGRE